MNERIKKERMNEFWTHAKFTNGNVVKKKTVEAELGGNMVRRQEK